MPAVAHEPEPVAVLACIESSSFSTLEHAEGREGRLVLGNRQAAYKAWHDRSEYLARRRESPTDELPAVYQSPIVRTVSTTFYDAGRHQPLPFPDSEE